MEVNRYLLPIEGGRRRVENVSHEERDRSEVAKLRDEHTADNKKHGFQTSNVADAVQNIVSCARDHSVVKVSHD